MNGQRDAFYQKRPDFEEGLANFTAAVCSTMQMMKAQRDVRGANLPMLHKGVYHDLLGDYAGFMRATYQAYHTESTDVFLQAWRANKLDYRAFAGILPCMPRIRGARLVQDLREAQEGRHRTSR